MLDRWGAKLRQDLQERVDETIAFVRELEGRSEVRKAEADRLTRLANDDRALAERLKAIVLDVMGERDLKRIDTDRFRVSRCQNSAAPLEIDIEAREAPEAYQRVSIELDRRRVGEDLKNGVPITWARFGPRGFHLRIR